MLPHVLPRLISDLGDSAQLTSFTGTERLGQPFSFDVQFVTQDDSLKGTDVLGKTFAVEITGPLGLRHFHGVAMRFQRLGRRDRWSAYGVTLRPLLWRLSMGSDCRIFTGKIPTAVSDTLKARSVPVDVKLEGDGRSSAYFVQYRESDYNFVSRLMEQEGIYYYFSHSATEHRMVLVNSAAKHDAFPGYGTLTLGVEDESIQSWGQVNQLESDGYTLGDFFYESPKPMVTPYKRATFEHFDYPGGFTADGDGGDYARIRWEELQAVRDLYEGSGCITGLATGALFTIGGNTDAGDYLVTGADYNLGPISYRSDGEADGDHRLHVHFTAIRKERPYRAPRSAHKPTVEGPQTAIVVGGKDDEIATDELGRIQVKFHWDRDPKTRSCFVRVAQMWAGPRWGGVFIPRVGQEVIVEFLEGDPDRPLVTGAVYNGDNGLPWDLPQDQTQSGIRSRSSKGGTKDNFNELRFEDKKGAEKLFLQAERDEVVTIKNDETRDVGHDRTVHVVNNETLTIDKDRVAKIGEKETREVGHDQTVTVGGARTVSVGKDEQHDVTGKRAHTVQKDDSLAVTGKQTVTVGKDMSLSIDGGLTESVGKDSSLDVGGKLQIVATDQIVLKAGDAQITIKKDGTILLKGKDIGLDGGGSINVKASSDLVLKGSKVGHN
jgi:type VI secretion system secreted protein VgrG